MSKTETEFKVISLKFFCIAGKVIHTDAYCTNMKIKKEQLLVKYKCEVLTADTRTKLKSRPVNFLSYLWTLFSLIYYSCMDSSNIFNSPNRILVIKFNKPDS